MTNINVDRLLFDSVVVSDMKCFYLALQNTHIQKHTETAENEGLHAYTKSCDTIVLGVVKIIVFVVGKQNCIQDTEFPM